eukprot:277479-Ditylum_brightwellii.AAC.1
MEFGLIPISNYMFHRLSWGTSSSGGGSHTSLSSLSSSRSPLYSSEEDLPFPHQINQKSCGAISTMEKPTQKEFRQN